MALDGSDTTRSWGNFFLSAGGGGLVTLVFLPTGCNREPDTLFHHPPVICPDGRQTNLLGSTIFGLVGKVDTAGAAVMGVVIACIFGIARLQSSA